MGQVVGEAELARWRAMDAAVIVLAIAQYAKRDPSFDPIKNPSTTRWHCQVGGHDFELLLTGPRFFDVRAEKGGGGAVDLAMHLLGVDFKTAVVALRSKLGASRV